MWLIILIKVDLLKRLPFDILNLSIARFQFNWKLMLWVFFDQIACMNSLRKFRKTKTQKQLSWFKPKRIWQSAETLKRDSILNFENASNLDQPVIHCFLYNLFFVQFLILFVTYPLKIFLVKNYSIIVGIQKLSSTNANLKFNENFDKYTNNYIKSKLNGLNLWNRANLQQNIFT